MTDTSNTYFDISNFRSTISPSGYNRTNLFQMHIFIPTGLLNTVVSSSGTSEQQVDFTSTTRNIVFDIERVTLPGISLATDEIRRYGIGYFDRKPYVPMFEQLQVVVRSDGDNKNYDFFQSWMKLIIGYGKDSGKVTATASGVVGTSGGSNGLKYPDRIPYEVAYKEDYAVNASITTFNEDNKESLKVTMTNFYPVYLGEINYDWADNNNIVKFPVLFTFSEWSQERVYHSPSNTQITTQ